MFLLFCQINMCALGVCAHVHLENAYKDMKQNVTVVLFSGE